MQSIDALISTFTKNILFPEGYILAPPFHQYLPEILIMRVNLSQVHSIDDAFRSFNIGPRGDKVSLTLFYLLILLLLLSLSYKNQSPLSTMKQCQFLATYTKIKLIFFPTKTTKRMAKSLSNFPTLVNKHQGKG